MPSCHFVHLILLSSGPKVPKSGPFKNEGIHEPRTTKPPKQQLIIFAWSDPSYTSKAHTAGARADQFALELGKPANSEAVAACPVLHGSFQLIHPLIFRRRSFATVGTNFD